MNPNESQTQPPDSGCYDCIHTQVCKYWGKWDNKFPYKSDSEIGPYLKGLAKTLSTACVFFIKPTIERR